MVIKLIDTLIVDFDGVLTDNRVFINESGIEQVCCSRSDGIGAQVLRELNVNVLILSTETSELVQLRAKKMGIIAYNGVKDKREFLVNYSNHNNIEMDKIGYIGNDLNDLNAMKLVGLRICPADAWKEIHAICNLILKKKGGMGVLREFSTLYYEFKNKEQ